MKHTHKQSLTVNALLLLLLALFFLSASLMWSKHNQYHSQQEMNWMSSIQSANVPMPFYMHGNE